MFSCQPSLVLLTSCGKCCVSKLREVAETWLRRPRKKRTGENRNIIIFNQEAPLTDGGFHEGPGLIIINNNKIITNKMTVKLKC